MTIVKILSGTARVRGDRKILNETNDKFSLLAPAKRDLEKP